MLKRRFSTTDVPMPQRLRIWQDYCAQHFFKLEVKVPNPDELSVVTQGVRAGAITTALSIFSEQEMVRHGPAGDRLENFAFVFPITGHIESLQRSRLVSVQPGQAYCLHPAEAYRTAFSDKPSTLVLSAPLAVVRERFKSVEDCFGRSDFANPELVPLLQSFGRSLVQLDASAEDAVRLQDTCLDLLGLMLETGRKPSEGDRIPWSMRDALRTKLRLFIKRNYARPGLSAIDAASQFGVSQRYIQKLMSEQGTTFGQAVIDCRLDEARRLLRSGKQVRIAEAASSCGFVNQAHFATRYRQRFGNSPRDELGVGFI